MHIEVGTHTHTGGWAIDSVSLLAYTVNVFIRLNYKH